MLIQNINASLNYKIEPNYCYKYQNNPQKYNNNFDTFEFSKNTTQTNKHQNLLSFLGVKTYLLDGGQHSSDMSHFAKAICNDMDIKILEVEANPIDALAKQMKSLKERLAQVNALPQEEKPDYLAIPLPCTVPLQNLSDQINSVCGKNICLTPENILTHKKDVLDFLKIISENPDKYRQHIEHMDKIGQGFEHVYDVIQEINQAVKSGIMVFSPAGHPQQFTLRWLSGKENLKPELRHFIATGEDINGSVAKMQQTIRDNNWYDFNLLNLSDARIVNLKDINGNDHIYSAYDVCVNEAQRGVYNFCPIKKDNKLSGFSFTDESTLQYPVEEYSALENISAITKFVGMPLERVLASDKDTEMFKKYLHREDQSILRDFSNMLFKVDDIFTPTEIEENKIRLKGDYIDASLKLYFRQNKDGKVIFPNCDYEQSGRPSVVSMWGSCFSMFNAIANNIKNRV